MSTYRQCGDHVKRGQLVATPNGLGANIHTSLSGVVESVDEMNIVVKLDKEQSDDYVKLEPTDDHLQRIKDAGIVGVGGAGFPNWNQIICTNTWWIRNS